MGERDAILMMIGKRGELTPQEAERMGGARWRMEVQRNPRAEFMIIVSGYDDDPRELWQISEVVSYVKLWAAAAGIGDVATAQRLHRQSLGLLGLCGVFGGQPPQIH